MKHPMQCEKCFRVCRLSDSGKTWVCTICKHREKAEGGQAVSDKTLIEWNADVGTRFLTIHPDGSFDIDKDAPPLFVIGELAKAFIRQQDRIKRLEEAGDAMATWLSDPRNLGDDPFMSSQWQKAKEAKP